MTGLDLLVQREINFRALSRKDGIFVFQGIHFFVKNNKALYYLCQDGTLLANHGNFNVTLGKIAIGYSDHKQKFKEVAKENKWL